jgi:hypothetical protein
MRNRSIFDLIDDYKSAVYLSIYRGGWLDPLQTNFRVISTNLANNRSTKLGTLNCSAHARTVRPTCTDRPARGPSGPRTVRPHTTRKQLIPVGQEPTGISNKPTRISNSRRFRSYSRRLSAARRPLSGIRLSVADGNN